LNDRIGEGGAGNVTIGYTVYKINHIEQYTYTGIYMKNCAHEYVHTVHGTAHTYLITYIHGTGTGEELIKKYILFLLT
jgi:hypothetical protein